MDHSLSAQDYKPFLTDIIRQLILILGGDITLSKLKAVPELTVGIDGTVTEMTGNTDEVVKKFKDAFFELSPDLVKTVIEPALTKAEHAGISSSNPTGVIPGLPA